VPIAATIALVPPLDQQRLIGEHGSPAAAVRAKVKGKADRAANKIPLAIDHLAVLRSSQHSNAPIKQESQSILSKIVALRQGRWPQAGPGDLWDRRMKPRLLRRQANVRS
jgi:hypothetical protein